MPSNRTEPYTVSIESSQGSAAEGFKVRVTNRNSKETLIGTFNSLGRALVDLAEYATQFANGDVLEIKVNGKIEGFTTHTVNTSGASSGGTDVSLTTAAVNSNLVSVSL